MFRFGSTVAIWSRLVWALVSSAPLLTNAAASHAGELPMVSTGPATMLQLRVPLGGVSRHPPRLTLSAGSYWRDAPGALHPSNYRFVPNIEAGFTLGSGPFLALGSVDVRKSFGARVNADGDAAPANGGNAKYVIAGVLAIGLAVWAVNASVDTYEAFDEVIDEDGP